MSYIERNKWHPITQLPPVWQERGVKLDLMVDRKHIEDAWWDARKGRWFDRDGREIDRAPTRFMVVDPAR
jgi:hypothetical protein